MYIFCEVTFLPVFTHFIDSHELTLLLNKWYNLFIVLSTCTVFILFIYY